MKDILEVIDTLGNRNYSFTLIPTKPKPNSFFNLIVSVQEGKSNYELSILEYRMSSDFAQAYRNGTKTTNDFTGSILTFPYIPSTTTFRRGSDTCIQNIDEVVNCNRVDIVDGSPVNTGGSGSASTTLSDISVPDYGGSTSGISTGGGGSVYWVCNAYHISHNRSTDCCCAGGGGTWIILLAPPSISTYRANPNSYGRSTTNCCDDTYVDGALGMNINNTANSVLNCLSTLNNKQTDWVLNSTNALDVIKLDSYLLMLRIQTSKKDD